MTLIVDKISTGYGEFRVLWDVSLKLQEGKIVAILGPNSSGKSTLLKAIVGLLPLTSGSITYKGVDISNHSISERVLRLGIVYAPHPPGLTFQSLTVSENLQLSVVKLNLNKDEYEKRLERVFDLFPILRERRDQLAGTLSGGERQMLNIAMGLMLNPKVLMLDEPSAGLAPKVKDELFERIAMINKLGTSILIVEQEVDRVLTIADYGYVLKGGRITLEGEPKYLLAKKDTILF